MTDPIAVYAAVVGSLGTVGGLGWNVWSWRRANETIVSIELQPKIIVPATGPRLVLAITVINDSAHPIRVSGVGVKTDDGDIQVVRENGEIPGQIPEHDSAMTWLPRNMPELKGTVVGWARLGARPGMIESEPLSLST